MKAIRIVLMTVLAVVLFGGTAFGAGLLLKVVEAPGGDKADAATPAAASPTPGESPTETPATVDPPEVSEAPTFAPPPPVMKPGDSGEQVRELQHRLFQLAWWGEKTTGTYDAATKAAVAGFQGKRGLPADGVVHKATWDKLVSMTRTPTHDEKFNILKPGPRILGPGDTGEAVRELQARLKELDWYSGDVTGTYGPTTTEGVRGFQQKRQIPVTGEVDKRTLQRLESMTDEPSYNQKYNIKPKPGEIDERCKTGRVLCIDKTTRTLKWVVDGQVLRTFEVRFGSDELPTREGVFSVYRKSRDHVSSLYDTSMPYAMFFSGGQAVHYSPDFAANGYSGASHGCVNVRNKAGIAALFDEVRLGDRVIIFWS